MPYKLVLTFVNVVSCYWSLFKYARVSPLRGIYSNMVLTNWLTLLVVNSTLPSRSSKS
jgi:hypothetical protein